MPIGVYKRQLVFGVGINDADYVVRPEANGRVVCCPFYRAWRNILARTFNCNPNSNPTYIGCKVCDSWLTFSNFKRWMEKQDWQGKQLDKDLLGDGKLYSPETCVFVTQAINNLTTDSAATRGEWPIGVHCHKQTKRFRSQVRVNGKQKYLGYFDTPEEAHQVWRKAKKALCLELITTQTCPRTIQGLRKYMRSI